VFVGERECRAVVGKEQYSRCGGVEGRRKRG
jgi:hypothetical protein